MDGDDGKCNLASELESDLRGVVNWDTKWLLNFNSGKAQHIPYIGLNNSGIKMDGCFFMEKESLKMLILSFNSELDGGAYVTSSDGTAM